MSQFTEIELTPKQKQQWEDTASLMVWTCPGWRHLWYKLLVNHKGQYTAIMTRDVPVAACDGFNIMINPDTFFELPLKQRVFVVAHEVVHAVYHDPAHLHRHSTAGQMRYSDGAQVPFDNEQYQISMDYRINALLVDSRVGELPTGKYAGFYDPKIAGANDAVLDIYRKIYKKKPPGTGKGGKAKQPGSGGGGQGGFDQVLPPGNSTGQHPHQAMQAHNPQQWATELAVARHLESQKYQGHMPGSLSRFFEEFLEPQVPWTEHIRGFLARKIGSGGYNWRRPDRRAIAQDIYMPSRSGFGAGWICIWGDTSGSISQDEMNAYTTELAGLLEELRPQRVTVFWCDAAVHQVDELTDAMDLATLKAKGIKGGGGGTACAPVFEAISEMSHEAPEAFIGFTDGHVNYPFPEPRFPVIWACTTDQPFPWGEIVRINPKAGATP